MPVPVTSGAGVHVWRFWRVVPGQLGFGLLGGRPNVQRLIKPRLLPVLSSRRQGFDLGVVPRGPPAVVFPLCNEQGAYVAANGRYIDGEATIPHR